MTEYQQIFFDEAKDHHTEFEAALDAFQRDAKPERLNEAFRAIHSIKGGADVLEFRSLKEFAHTIETLLDLCRLQPNEVDSEVLHCLYDCSDRLLELILATQRNDAAPISVLETEKRIKSLLQPTVPAATTTPEVRPEPIRIELFDEEPEPIVPETSDRKMVPEIVIPPAPLDGVNPIRFAQYLCHRGVVECPTLLEALQQLSSGIPTLGELAIRAGRMTEETVARTQESIGNDEDFGLAAVRLGYLEATDLNRLYVLQQRSGESLLDILFFNGAAPRYILEDELSLFRSNAEAPISNEPTAPPETTSSAADVPEEASIEVEIETDWQEPEVSGPPVVLSKSHGLAENLDIIEVFCSESFEHIEKSDRYLLILDSEPTNREALDALYCAFHTIKGGGGMLGVESIKLLAHEAENMFNLVRDGKMLLGGESMDLSFATVDSLRSLIEGVKEWPKKRGELRYPPELPDLIQKIRRVTSSVTKGTGGSDFIQSIRRATEAVTQGKKGFAKKSLTTAPHDLANLPPLDSIHPVDATPTAPPATEKANEPTAPPAEANNQPNKQRGPVVADKETVRVDRDRLDKLINAIGELMIAQSMAQQELAEAARNSGVFSQAMPELMKISRDLQELSLSLRMVPLQSTFQKMARLVRDLSRKLNKPVDFELHGEETELDKTVVDQLGDPLLHMVRNAIDHGLETPEQRQALGKPVNGQVSLKAYYQGGSVYIELTDDGRGLNRELIFRKAVEKGIIPAEARLTDDEIHHLIFAPGFSTAAAVTDVSGRGVGMDVVRRNVEALQGSILIRTELGKGTTFTIRLPLTLAIIDGLTVGLGEDVYLFPLLSVVESFQPNRSDLHLIAGKGEVVIVHGETIPLLRLYEILNRPPRSYQPHEGLVVIVEDEGRKLAIFVDEVLGQMQAVVKSLDMNFRRVEGISGATILGDGRVAIILDVHGLTQLQRHRTVDLSSMMKLPVSNSIPNSFA